MSYQPDTRISFGPELTPAVKILLGINGVVYLLLTVDRTLQVRILDQWLSLVPALVIFRYQVWRLITYMFLHGPNPMHLMFNMLVLWMFGPEIERILGSRRFVRFYLFTGLAAGLCSLAVSPRSPYPVIGASGAMYALMLAFALYYPNRYLLLFFFVPVRAKFLVAGTILLEVYFSVSGVQDGIAHVAHLGGLFFGYLFLKRKTMLPDFRYRYLRLKGWWYRRKFKVHPGGRSGRGNGGWTN